MFFFYFCSGEESKWIERRQARKALNFWKEKKCLHPRSSQFLCENFSRSFILFEGKTTVFFVGKFAVASVAKVGFSWFRWTIRWKVGGVRFYFTPSQRFLPRVLRLSVNRKLHIINYFVVLDFFIFVYYFYFYFSIPALPPATRSPFPAYRKTINNIVWILNTFFRPVITPPPDTREPHGRGAVRSRSD